MKTIILSDISGHSESMIPYGLNIGKHTETDVEIIHMLDPREHQGATSPYSDSQSVSPGEVQDPKEILNKEKTRVQHQLDQLLSKEASRLNYPLRINIRIETEYLEGGLKKILNEHPESILVTSSEPGKSVIKDVEELFSIVKRLAAPVIITPPGAPFIPPQKILMIPDLSEGGYNRVLNTFQWLKPFEPEIFAFEIVTLEKVLEMELKMNHWEEVINRHTGSDIRLKTGLLKGQDYLDTLINNIENSDPQMVIIPRIHKNNERYSMFPENRSMQVVQSSHKPVLLY